MRVKITHECEKHEECLRELISDYRHIEDVGLVFILMGLTVLSMISLIPATIIISLIIIIIGVLLCTFGGIRKKKYEIKLHELLENRNSKKR